MTVFCDDQRRSQITSFIKIGKHGDRVWSHCNSTWCGTFDIQYGQTQERCQNFETTRKRQVTHYGPPKACTPFIYTSLIRLSSYVALDSNCAGVSHACCCDIQDRVTLPLSAAISSAQLVDAKSPASTGQAASRVLG